MLFVRAKGELDVLFTLSIHGTNANVIRLVSRPGTSKAYGVEQRTSCVRPYVTRVGMEKLNPTSYV